MRIVTPWAARRQMTRIEIRACIWIRSLPVDMDGRISKIDADEILRAMMARVRG